MDVCVFGQFVDTLGLGSEDFKPDIRQASA